MSAHSTGSCSLGKETSNQRAGFLNQPAAEPLACLQGQSLHCMCSSARKSAKMRLSRLGHHWRPARASCIGAGESTLHPCRHAVGRAKVVETSSRQGFVQSASTGAFKVSTLRSFFSVPWQRATLSVLHAAWLFAFLLCGLQASLLPKISSSI